MRPRCRVRRPERALRAEADGPDTAAGSGVTRAGNVREVVIPNLFRDLKAERSKRRLSA
jgi:hypothetical protein